jgi:hypothetical protein
MLPRPSGPHAVSLQLIAVLLVLAATIASARLAVRTAMLLLALLSVVNVAVGCWWSLASPYSIAHDVLLYAFRKSCGALRYENVVLHVTHAFA